MSAPDDSAAPAARRPDLFIIGAPKCGTSSLYGYLSGHPDVYMSPVKEPFYFATDDHSPRSKLRFGKDAERYAELFADARAEKRLGEASTGYLRSMAAPALVREFQPDARIIVMLRNPVELVYALHNERVSHGAEDVADFAAAMALDEARQNEEHLPPGSNGMAASYKDKARFAPQLGRWIEAFGRERVHIIVLEEFAAETEAAFARVLEFLDVDPGYRPASFEVINRSHRLRGGVVRRVVASRPTRWTRNRLMPALLGPNATARLAFRFRHSRLMRRANPRPPLADGLRTSLEGEFRDDVRAVSELLGRDLEQLWFGRSARRPARAGAGAAAD